MKSKGVLTSRSDLFYSIRPNCFIDEAFDRANTLSAQLELTARGFDPGPIDAAWGAKTTSALKAFQKSIGLPGIGTLDVATRKALSIE